MKKFKFEFGMKKGFVIQLCKENMEGKSFYVKGGKIFCKNHANTRYWGTGFMK